MEMPKRIEICGGIAAGKTTLAKVLECRGYNALYERFEDNPFLSQFYQNGEQSNAFETEIVFTLLHYNQIKQRHHMNNVVSDFSLLQDYSYGICNLSEAEKKVFTGVYDYLLEMLVPVGYIIYLKCDVECLLERIRKRSRDMEMTISKSYLQETIKNLEHQLEKVSHLLVIDSEKYDFRGADQEEIVRLIQDCCQGKC